MIQTENTVSIGSEHLRAEQFVSNTAGIDFGSVNAGTTALAYFQNDILELSCSVKGRSADDFILNNLPKNIRYVFIDAPLSLPAAFQEEGEDYMFRECDRQTGAMSPMFLGGLTARAIRLKNLLNKQGIRVLETYPSYLARQILKWSSYRNEQSFEQVIDELAQLQLPLKKIPEDQHQLDAVLAWYSGQRYLNDRARIIGSPGEGSIIV